MQKRVYILEPEICRRVRLHSVILQLSAPVVLASRADTLPPLFASGYNLTVVLVERMEGSHRFPSKHIRILGSLEAARGRGYHVPPFLGRYLDDRPANVIIIRDGGDTDTLLTALRNYHLRDPRTGAWLGEKRKKKSRLSRLIERRRERREQYALP